MRERPKDTGIAIALAIGLHALVGSLMIIGWRMTPAPEALSVAGSPIEVDLLSSAFTRGPPRPVPATPPPAMERPAEQEAAPAPQPEPEPAPQDAVVAPQPAPQAPQAVPDVREQERVARDAVSPQPPAAREQEERRRQEQIDLTERERQAAAEERQRRSQQQIERLQRLAALREQREQITSESRVEQQRLEQRRDLAQQQPPTLEPPAGPSGAQATPMAGNDGVDTGLEAAYVLALQNAIERNWIRPETIPPGTPCTIRVVQIPGGQVLSAEVVQPCSFDAIGQRSLEAAVKRAEPLPSAGFEAVFRRELLITFRAPQD